MRILLLSLLLSITVFTTACPQGPSKKLPGITNTKSLVQNINTYLATAQTEFDDAIEADPTDASGNARRIRNDAIDQLLAVIDDSYTDFISNIESQRSKTDFVLDVIDLGTGAATGITKGERPNQILGIAMTAFRGGRRSSDLNFYKQQTTPILIAKMDDNRSIVLAEILEKRDDSGAAYSMRAAIRDMVNYFNAGTLVRAFTELSKSTAAQAQASQQRVRQLSGPLTISSIPSLDLTQVLRQINTQKISLAQQIADAKRAAPLAPAGAPANVAAAARAAQQTALQPIRRRLETIWRNIESSGKFDAAINEVRTNAAHNTIINDIENNPSNVTEENYLALLFALQGALDMDLDLNRELLTILTTVSP
jgi:hypothetical protein